MTVTLVPPPVRTAALAPDADQRRVVEHRGPALLVRGAAGTGKTTTALALVAERVASGEVRTEDVLVLAPTRRAAARLRDDLSARLGRTTGQPVVRTPASAAFSILRARASLLGEPAPTLISGPEQDLVLAELLAGHAAGEGARVAWPARVPAAAVGLRAFRDELRDLLMRAAERGLRPAELARLGEEHGRPEWVSAAAVYAEYLDVTRLRSGTPDAGARYDAAVVVDEAAEALHAWEQEVPGAPRPSWRLVVVDDYQETTAATARLLHVLVAGGADLVLLADPDAAVQTFRGATPGLAERAGAAPGSGLGAFGADEVVLGTVWRHGGALRDVVRAVTREIRGPGRSQRAAAPAPGAHDGEVTVRFLRSPAQEAAYVAHALRSAHLHDGVAWSRMAVVVRSGGQVTELRRALLAAQVPVAVVGSDVALRAEPAVRPLLLALGAVLSPRELDAELAAELLVSPLGGIDAVGLRRVRRALRAEELAGGGDRSSDELLVEALGAPERSATLPVQVRRPVQRLARVIGAGREAAGAAGAGVLDVLWALWSAADLAEPWRRRALAGGTGGARADRDLDAVLALFKAAEQFVDRLPMAPPTAFLDHLRAQDLPADSLAAQGDVQESVPVLTAAAAAGGEWDVCVVAGVQEGIWPDLRLRDSLLGAQHLVELLAGRAVPAASAAAPGASVPAVSAEARAAVLDDELRAFAVAVSRARRRLLVTAVQDTDHQPSGLLDLLGPDPAEGAGDPRLVAVPPPLDLRAVVARCRATLEGAALARPLAEPALADHPAAALLRRLAAEGVPGADPAQWYGVCEPSTSAPLWPADGPVPLSPSKIESAATCALRWALEAAGGTAADSGEQSLGTLVHAVAAALPRGDEAELAALLDERWGELRLGDGWVGSVQRRRADAMVRHLARYLRDAGDVVAVEEPFEARVGRVLLRGTVDRLERVPADDEGPDRVRVVDLKTGRATVSADAAGRHAQLGAYQEAVAAGAFAERVGQARPGGAALVYVGTTQKSPPVREQAAPERDAEPDWARRLLDDVATTVSASAMAATTNDLCRRCPVARSCPAQPEGRVVGA
ncbi:ATP-dependent DNA helicase [Actinotalea sp. JY-7876]|uniref:ATP-dependent helicase n=2 Tax=unclassified Actinotalea TaxID=2638618 RepID=UPI0021078B6F|nr:ATP-dependent DNA helicase [Actinotalea sp. JY-7876]